MWKWETYIISNYDHHHNMYVCTNDHNNGIVMYLLGGLGNSWQLQLAPQFMGNMNTYEYPWLADRSLRSLLDRYTDGLSKSGVRFSRPEKGSTLDQSWGHFFWCVSSIKQKNLCIQMVSVSGHQTRRAGKWTIKMDDFPSQKPPFSSEIFQCRV